MWASFSVSPTSSSGRLNGMVLYTSPRFSVSPHIRTEARQNRSCAGFSPGEAVLRLFQQTLFCLFLFWTVNFKGAFILIVHMPDKGSSKRQMHIKSIASLCFSKRRLFYLFLSKVLNDWYFLVSPQPYTWTPAILQYFLFGHTIRLSVSAWRFFPFKLTFPNANDCPPSLFK